MNAPMSADHMAGIRRTLAFAREVAALYETEAGTGSECDRTAVKALRLFADAADAALLPRPAGGGLDGDDVGV